MSRPVYLHPPPVFPVFAGFAAVWLVTAVNSIAHLFADPVWITWLPRAALLAACPAAAWWINRIHFVGKTAWRYLPHSQTFEYCQWQGTRWQVRQTLAGSHIAGIAAEQIYQNGIPITARVWLQTDVPAQDPGIYTLGTFDPDRETGFQAMQQWQQRIAGQTNLPVIPCVFRQQAGLGDAPADPEQFQAAQTPCASAGGSVPHPVWIVLVITAGAAVIRYTPQLVNEQWADTAAWAVAAVLWLYALSGCLRTCALWRKQRTQCTHNRQPGLPAAVPPRNPDAKRHSLQIAGFSRRLWFAAAAASILLILFSSTRDLQAALVLLAVAGSVLPVIWHDAQSTRRCRYNADNDSFEWYTFDFFLHPQIWETAPARNFIGILPDSGRLWLIGTAGSPNKFIGSQNDAQTAVQTADRLAQATGLPVIERRK